MPFGITSALLFKLLDSAPYIRYNPRPIGSSAARRTDMRYGAALCGTGVRYGATGTGEGSWVCGTTLILKWSMLVHEYLVL